MSIHNLLICLSKATNPFCKQIRLQKVPPVGSCEHNLHMRFLNSFLFAGHPDDFGKTSVHKISSSLFARTDDYFDLHFFHHWNSIYANKKFPTENSNVFFFNSKFHFFHNQKCVMPWFFEQTRWFFKKKTTNKQSSIFFFCLPTKIMTDIITQYTHTHAPNTVQNGPNFYDDYLFCIVCRQHLNESETQTSLRVHHM